jgi:hypothetical protein
LWATLDALRENLGRPAARFEFRQAIEATNEMLIASGKPKFNDSSVSFQYFKWRTFNGVKSREVGIYPKRNSFEISVPVVRTPRKPKEAPAESATPPAKKAARGAGKTVGGVAAAVVKVEAPAPASVPPAPVVSSRLAGISKEAAASE